LKRSKKLRKRRKEWRQRLRCQSQYWMVEMLKGSELESSKALLQPIVAVIYHFFLSTWCRFEAWTTDVGQCVGYF
jgi:hypothetical protein